MSSNTYFITNGLHVAGISNIVRLGQRFHLGERDRPAHPPGGQRHLPQPEASQLGLVPTATPANLCIGQGPMAVTPLQMAVMTAAIANGGKVSAPAPGGPHRTAGRDLGEARPNYFPSGAGAG